MHDRGSELGLFPIPTDPPSTNIVELRGTGIIASQHLRAMADAHEIGAVGGILPDQIQPASIDLRLGRKAYRVRASFLPGPNATVMEKVKDLDGFPAIDLADGAVFEKGAVYVVELLESAGLPSAIEGVANPKSSTGRLDVLTRLITDKGVAFDRIERGYRGPLFLEVAPLTFSIIVRQGSRLSQARFQRGRASVAATELERLYTTGQIVKSDTQLLPLRADLVPVSVDLVGGGGTGVVGYRAKKNASKIDVDLVRHYDARDFWERITPSNGRLDLNKGDFYILGTREEVGVPPHLAAEMVPYDPASGEFRVHYAGFFDPGFGWSSGLAGGSKAVLEVRSHGVSFMLEHGQIIGWLRYTPIAVGRPDKIYGEAIRSNYQGQGVALAKHFLPFPP